MSQTNEPPLALESWTIVGKLNDGTDITLEPDDLRKSLYKVGAEIIGGQKTEKTKQAKRFTRRGMGNGQSNQK